LAIFHRSHLPLNLKLLLHQLFILL